MQSNHDLVEDEFFNACKNGEIDKLKELLARKDSNGKTIKIEANTQIKALYISCFNGNSEVVDLLIQTGAVDNYNLATQTDREDILKELFPLVPQSRLAVVDPLRIAIEQGHIEVVKLLLNNSYIDFANNNYGALRYAIEHYPKAADIFLAHKKIDKEKMIATLEEKVTAGQIESKDVVIVQQAIAFRNLREKYKLLMFTTNKNKFVDENNSSLSKDKKDKTENKKPRRTSKG